MPSWSASDFASRPPPDPPKKPEKPEKKAEKPEKPAAAKPAPPPPAPPKPSAPAKPAAAAPPKAVVAAPRPAAAAVAAPAAPVDAPAAEGDMDLAPREERVQTAAPPQDRTHQPVSTCQMCGYMTQGKLRERCPQCSGTMQTGASDLLKFSSKGWLHGATFAMTLAVIGIGMHGTAAFFRFTVRPLAAAMHPAASVVLMIAVFLATRDERRPHLERSPSAPLSRIAVTLATALWILAAIFYFRNRTPTAEQFRSTTLAAYLGALLADAALALCFGFYMNHLAGRIPDDSLSSHTQNSAYGCTCACLMFAFCHFIGVAAPDYMMWFVCAFPIIAVGGAFLVWPMLTLLRMATGFRHAAKEADLVAARRRAAEFNST